MNFKEEIIKFEKYNTSSNYIHNIDSACVLFTSVHDIRQYLDNGVIKESEPYTKAIALYLSKYSKSSYFIKTKDTGIDSNKDNHDEFKTKLLDLVKHNNIKLIIDLHGASIERDFDVELGTLNNLSADNTTINELKEALMHNGINNINENDPFKGGAITQYLFGINDIEVIQLEINRRYRNIEDIEKLEKLCKSLIYFVNQYDNCVNK